MPACRMRGPIQTSMVASDRAIASPGCVSVDRGGSAQARLTIVPQDAPSKGASADDNLAFEQLIEKLEGVVQSLEQGDTPLEEALTTFERGVGLARLGARRLDEAERRIELLLADEEGVRTRPMDPEGGKG